jgi:hypothetical protein
LNLKTTKALGIVLPTRESFGVLPLGGHIMNFRYAKVRHIVVIVLAIMLAASGTPLSSQETGTQETLLEGAAVDALRAKEKHRADVFEKLKRKKSVERPFPPKEKTINDYPRGPFENLNRSRLQWVKLDEFQFIPKSSMPFSFVRSTNERIAPRNFFTDGGSMPRFFRWTNELDPFGYLPPYLIHDWEFDLHHCDQSAKKFEDVANTMMEALRTLMDDGYLPRDWRAFWLIEMGINSYVARELWQTMPDKCPIPPYNPE